MAPESEFELLGYSFQELVDLVERFGEAGFRARQLFEALYRQRVPVLEAISTLPQAFRSKLISEGYVTGFPAVERRFVSADGTVRYLVRFRDGQSVETVWMPEGDGAEDGDETAPGNTATTSAVTSSENRTEDATQRGTICLSSQAGCAVNCAFCMTALLGLQRNLSAGEIVGQVLLVLNDMGLRVGRDRINLVFMGQGEPFLNYANFMRAVQLLVSGAGLAESRMTVSTSGIVPRIAEFGGEPVRPHLAISLNASNAEGRGQLMPITRKWSLDALLAAAREFPLRPRERLTFEYVLLGGVNDGEENAREVVELLRSIRAKVNLIALNPGPEIAFRTPQPEAVAAFQRTLIASGIPAYLRRPRGLDIYAACGQLKRTTSLVELEQK